MMLYHLLRSMDRSRFKLEVVTLMTKSTKLGNSIEKLGIPVHSLNIRRGQISASVVFRLRRLIRLLQPNIVQGYMYHGNLLASLACLLLANRIPVLWNIHHVPYTLKKEKLGTAICILLGAIIGLGTFKIIFVSRISEKRHQELGYSAKRSIVIPNGFDCYEFKPSSEAREKLRTNYGLVRKGILIGLIGRFHPMKDHGNFFKAAGILMEKYSHVEFVLAGFNVDSSNKKIVHYIEANGLVGKVHLLGVRDSIPEIMAGLDIYTNSSNSEAFPLVIGEAMACGVPCVVTDVGDSAWLVGSTGKVVPARNPKALAEAWSVLIDVGFEERLKLGLQARDRIISKFSIEDIVHKFEVLYEQITSTTKPRIL